MAKLATFPSQGEYAVCAYFYSQVVGSLVAKLKAKSFRAQVFNYPALEIYSLTGFAICTQESIQPIAPWLLVFFGGGSDQYVIFPCCLNFYGLHFCNGRRGNSRQ